MADGKATTHTCALCPRHEKEIKRLRGQVDEYSSRQSAMLQRINELGHQILNGRTRDSYEGQARSLKALVLRLLIRLHDGAAYRALCDSAALAVMGYRGTMTLERAQRLQARVRRLRAKADRIARGAR